MVLLSSFYSLQKYAQLNYNFGKLGLQIYRMNFLNEMVMRMKEIFVSNNVHSAKSSFTVPQTHIQFYLIYSIMMVN